jgi:uncharacterized membrane protein
MKISHKIRTITMSAVIAGLYTALTMLSYAFGLDKGAIQLRLSESLAVLPALTPAAIPGLFMGCMLSSFLCAAHLLDVLFGSLVTLVAAMICYAIRGAARWRLGAFLFPLPNVLLNALFIPLLLMFVYGVGDAYPFLFLTVGVGELITSGIFGMLLYFAMKKNQKFFRL